MHSSDDSDVEVKTNKLGKIQEETENEEPNYHNNYNYEL